MFPLGSVIFPYSAVPLRVFEPRYLTLLERVQAGDGMFGTVLIERGLEVGGGDSRFAIGTTVKVVGATDLPEGDKAIVIAGVERLRIVEWLEDDPHPWARVETIHDTTETFDVSGLIETASNRLTRVMALASELGADTSEVDLTIAEDPVAASYQLAALSPVVSLDAYSLLAAGSVDERLELNIELLEDRIEIIRAELSGQA